MVFRRRQFPLAFENQGVSRASRHSHFLAEHKDDLPQKGLARDA